MHEKTVWGTYDLTFRFDKGVVYAERKLVVLGPKVPVSEWKAYKKWTETIANQTEPYIQLRRGSSPASAITASPKTPEKSVTGDDANDSAETLIKKAGTALQHLDSEKAKELLKLAEAKDPKAPRLWSTRAEVAIGLGIRGEATEDAKKEVELHPEEVDAYRVMFNADQMNADSAGMEQALRKWVALDPEDPRVELALAGVLDLEKKYPEAVVAADKGIALMPGEDAAKNEPLQMMEGKDQLRAGMIEKGDATLTRLLKSTNDTLIMNNAAYELAEARLELPLDEQKSREALERLAVESRTWTLDEAPNVLRGKTSLMVASWDTLGWILFREGKTGEAKAYLEAAMMNRPDDEIKGHLEQVNKAMGLNDKPPMKKLPRADITVTAKPIGQELRTYPLGPANGNNGTAEYKLLISSGQVERMEATGSKTIPNVEEPIRHLNLSKLFPPKSEAKLVKMGIVNCYGGKCFLVLEP